MHPVRVAGRESERLVGGVGDEDVDRDDDVRLVEDARPEGRAVRLDGIEDERRGDVVVRAERQTELPGELGARAGGAAVQPHLDVLALGGGRVDRHALGGDVRAGDEGEDVADVLLEAVGVAGGAPEEPCLRDEASGVEGERTGGGKQEPVDDAILARRRLREAGGRARRARATDAEVEPSRMQRRHDARGLDDLQG